MNVKIYPPNGTYGTVETYALAEQRWPTFKLSASQRSVTVVADLKWGARGRRVAVELSRAEAEELHFKLSRALDILGMK